MPKSPRSVINTRYMGFLGGRRHTLNNTVTQNVKIFLLNTFYICTKQCFSFLLFSSLKTTSTLTAQEKTND